jgi:hypothetical protein
MDEESLQKNGTIKKKLIFESEKTRSFETIRHHWKLISFLHNCVEG